MLTIILGQIITLLLFCNIKLLLFLNIKVLLFLNVKLVLFHDIKLLFPNKLIIMLTIILGHIHGHGGNQSPAFPQLSG